MSLKGVKQAKNLDNGMGVCKYFDRMSKLCTIYDTRPEICNVEKGYKFFQDKISYNEYLELNYKICEELRRTKR